MNLSSENIRSRVFQQNPWSAALARDELPDQPRPGLQRARGQLGGGEAQRPQHPAGPSPQAQLRF